MWLLYVVSGDIVPQGHKKTRCDNKTIGGWEAVENEQKPYFSSF
jgi:hypothetical protein